VDAVVSILEALVAVPSVSSDAGECGRAVDTVRGLLPQGLTLVEVERDGTRSLVASTRPSRAASLVLNAHLDVVPARPGQFSVARDGSVARGRGVYDMKGAAAVYVQLLRDIGAMPEASRPDLQVQFVTDEEIGGHRGSAVLVKEGFTGGFFIAGEPTDLRVCNRAKGVLWLTVRIPGRPGHAAMPWQGDNPIVRSHDGLRRVLERFPVPEAECWTTTATPSAISGGEAHNRVPEHVVLKLDVRPVPDDDPTEIRAFVAACFPGAEVHEAQRAAALGTPVANPRVRELMEAQAAVTGSEPALIDAHYASDARYWSAVGVPAVCWGPAGGGMHADGEWLDLHSLGLYDRILRRLVGLSGS